MARVIIGSLVAHAALLAMFDTFVDGAPRSGSKRPPIIELVEPYVPADDPIEVAILEPQPAAAQEAPTSSRAPAAAEALVSSKATQTTRARPSAITTTPTPSIVEVPAGSSDTPPAPERPGSDRPSMSMRGPGRPAGPDLTIHEDIPHDAPPAREKDARTSEKKIEQNGTEYVVPDLVTTMHVSRDGRASFEDKPDIEVHVLLPSLDFEQTAKDLGNHLAGWYRDPYAQKHARKYQDMPRHEQAVPGGWDAGAGGDANIDGSIEQPDELPRRPSNGIVPVIGGKLDITSWLHRKFIGDPYASRKRVLLDGTRAQRAEIRKKYTREQLDQSAVIMRKNVERVFVELADPAQQRQALFALWDECAEGDDDAGRAGDRARAMVIGAIRGRLSEAYGTDEIAALDAKRTSAQHFVPYD